MVRTLETLLHGAELVEIRGDVTIPVNDIAYDSRKVGPGDVFVAIPGTRQDGSAFIQDAIQKGAAAVVTEVLVNETAAATFVRVKNGRRALARLAANFYGHPSRDFQLIGVTGTNGKTTTTHLLESILKQGGHSVGVLGTLAYRWADKDRRASMTTPESLDLQRLFHEMRSDGVTAVVMEVSSHALALERVEGCSFAAAVFTNLSQDHLDFHSTMEDYFTAKSSLFSRRWDPGRGCALGVINMDDPYGQRLVDGYVKGAWTYAVTNRKASVWVKEAHLIPSGLSAVLSTPSGDLRIHSPLLGRLNLYNVLSAATTALALGMETAAIARGLAELSQVDGRLQRVPVPSQLGYQVIVDYAHTPDAMEKSLSCLKEMTKGRLLVVFGCGGDRDRGKRPLMGNVAARLGDLVILTSDNPRSEVPEEIISEIEPGVKAQGLARLKSNGRVPQGTGYFVEVDRERAIELAVRWALPGDVIFIGGKGHETYQIVGDSVLPFDDRLVVRGIFESLEKNQNG